MIPYSRTIFAVGSANLEDLPTGIGADAAQDYLTAWTSLWDPRLIAATGVLPEWKRADTAGLDVQDSVIVCPEWSLHKVDQPLLERVHTERNAWIPSARRSRGEVVGDLLRAVAERLSAEEPAIDAEGESATSRASQLKAARSESSDCPWIDDFYAFGYAVLQVQCMARQLRYSFNLDWMMLGEQLLQGAQASVAGDATETERWLTAAFDALSQERDRYCSQSSYLLEMILTAPTTLGSVLAAQCEVDRPLTLYCTTKNLRAIQASHPETWNPLSRRLREGSIVLAGGLREERPHALLHEMSLVRELHRARTDCQELGIEPPTVWTRYLPSLVASTPTVLRQFGFAGALLSPFGGGHIPSKDHAKVRWQFAGESLGLDCILGHVLDASDAESLLSLGQRMAKQLDYHQVPTLVLAHWPSGGSSAFEDLVRAVQRTPALGKWTDAAHYFSSTAQPYWTDQYGAESFRIPLPESASELHRLHAQCIVQLQRSHGLEQLESLTRLWQWVPRSQSHAGPAMDWEALRGRIAALRDASERAWDPSPGPGISVQDWPEGLDAAIEDVKHQVLEELGKRVPGDEELVVLNPASHPQRVTLAGCSGELHASGSARLHASHQQHNGFDAVLDLPSFGFAKLRVSESHASGSTTRAAHPTGGGPQASWLGRIFGSRATIAEPDGSMANEFMEVQIDPEQGHLRSMYVANKRGNRLSGRLSVVSDPLGAKNKVSEPSFLAMSAVGMKVIESSPVRGCIEVQGDVRLPANPFQSSASDSTSRWTVRYTLTRGSRRLEIEILGEGVDLHACYPAWRMVWPSQAATIASWQNGTRGKLPQPLQGTVELIEIDDAEHKIQFATRGLSHHCRLGSQGLLSALPVSTTGQVAVRFSIGMDWPRPWEMAMDTLGEPLWVRRPFAGASRSMASDRAASDSAAWLAQANVANLRFHWIDPAPTLEVSAVASQSPDSSSSHSSSSHPAEGSADSSPPPPAVDAEAMEADACWWVVEMAGKSGTARLSCLRPIQKAWKVDFRGREYDRLKVEDGEVLLPFRAWERSRIAFCF